MLAGLFGSINPGNKYLCATTMMLIATNNPIKAEVLLEIFVLKGITTNPVAIPPTEPTINPGITPKIIENGQAQIAKAPAPMSASITFPLDIFVSTNNNPVR